MALRILLLYSLKREQIQITCLPQHVASVRGPVTASWIATCTLYRNNYIIFRNYKPCTQDSRVADIASHFCLRALSHAMLTNLSLPAGISLQHPHPGVAADPRACNCPQRTRMQLPRRSRHLASETTTYQVALLRHRHRHSVRVVQQQVGREPLKWFRLLESSILTSRRLFHQRLHRRHERRVDLALQQPTCVAVNRYQAVDGPVQRALQHVGGEFL